MGFVSDLILDTKLLCNPLMAINMKSFKIELKKLWQNFSFIYHYYCVDKHLTIKQSNEWKHVFINHVTPHVVFGKWAEHMFSSTTSFPLLFCSTASVCVHNCKNDLNHMFWLTFMTIIHIYSCLCKFNILALISWVKYSYYE